MTAREEHIKEIERVKAALEKTDSPHLKRDYSKYLKRLYRELKEFDRRSSGGNYQGKN